MRIGTMLASVVLVAGVILFGGCMAPVDEEMGDESAAVEATADENVGEAEQALTSCTNSCDCPINNYCSNGFCTDVHFGPLPPEPYCFGSCQCAWYERCIAPYGEGTAGFCEPWGIEP